MKRFILILAIGIAGVSYGVAQPQATDGAPEATSSENVLNQLTKVRTDDLTLDIAQLREVAPELVRATSRQKAFRPGDPKGLTRMETVYDVDYQKLAAMMIKAVQEQQAIINRQQAELDRLRDAVRTPQQ